MKKVRLFLGIQALITLIGALVLAEATNGDSAASFAIGGAIVFGNVLSLAFAWSKMIQKKLIALSVSIIVFKYAILGIIIYKVLSFPWVDKMWLSVGLSSLILSTLFYASVAPSGDDEEENKENKE